MAISEMAFLTNIVLKVNLYAFFKIKNTYIEVNLCCIEKPLHCSLDQIFVLDVV